MSMYLLQVNENSIILKESVNSSHDLKYLFLFFLFNTNEYQVLCYLYISVLILSACLLIFTKSLLIFWLSNAKFSEILRYMAEW